MNKQLALLIKEVHGSMQSWEIMTVGRLVDWVLKNTDALRGAVEKSGMQSREFTARLGNVCSVDESNVDTGYVRYRLTHDECVLVERLRVSIGLSKLLDRIMREDKECSIEDLLVRLINKGESKEFKSRNGGVKE